MLNFPGLTVPVLWMGVLLCGRAALADSIGDPNYTITKNYTFTTNQNVKPDLSAARYGHVYDYNLNGGGVAENTAGQNYAGGYDPFARDSFDKRHLPGNSSIDPNKPNSYSWAIFNQPKGKPSVQVVLNSIQNMDNPPGIYNQNFTAGNALANVNLEVTNRAAKTASGTVAIDGSVTAPEKGEQLFSMGYANLAAKANGVNLAGTITDDNSVVINNLGVPRVIGGAVAKAGAWDPITITETNQSGSVLDSRLLYESGAEVDGWGLIDWENDQLNIQADNGFFYVAEYPFSLGDPTGSLMLNVVNDAITLTTTGTVFAACQATQKLGFGSFSCTLPTDVSFNYNYNSPDGNPIGVEVDFSELGTAEISAPEPATYALLGFAFIILGLLSRRRSAHPAPQAAASATGSPFVVSK